MNNLAVNIGDVFFQQQGTRPSNAFNSLSGVASLVSLFLRITFTLAGLILLFYFILGGIGMITAAGKGDPKAAEQAKQTLTTAVVGFVIVITSYWVVKLLLTILGLQDII